MSRNLEYQRKRAVQYISGKIKPWAFIFAMVGCALCFLLASASVTPVKYAINEGDIAQATITAPRDTIDRVTTEELKSKAMEEVKPVYKLDKQVTGESLKNMEAYFNLLEEIRLFCENEYISEKMASSNSTDYPSFSPQDVKWNTFLTIERLNKLKDKLNPAFNDDEIKLIASIKRESLLNLKTDILKLTQDELNIGIQEKNFNDQIMRLSAQIMSNTAYSENMRSLAVDALSCIKPNMFYDSATTEAEKKAAAQSVLPAIYKKGQNIVQIGEAVTKARIEVLKDLGLKQDNSLNYNLYIGVFLYVLLCFVFFGFYTQVFNRELLKSIKYVLLTGLIVLMSVGISIPLSRLEPRIITVYLGTFLACILISPKSAVGITFLLSFLTGFINGSNEGIISESMLITVLCGITGGFTVILFLRKAHHRTEYIYSGIAAGLVNSVVFTTVGLLKGNGFSNVLPDGMWAMINGISSAMLAIGALPVLETMFRIATATRLLEILNPNQPLLRRLSLETPGTYHHSIITANLAEAAAESLNLDTLLVKAAAYYHDIGKLKKPDFYKENQQGGINPHDQLEPQKSAAILREHVISGKYMAIKYKLPKDIADLIEQHHGTTVMPYFYNKAKETLSSVKMDDYRYKGLKPQSKEALIIMLADCVEAAVRANGTTQKEKIKDIIDKLIKERMEDRQFDECDVTQKDLSCIMEAFISVYFGMFHERIQYPEGITDVENNTGL